MKDNKIHSDTTNIKLQDLQHRYGVVFNNSSVYYNSMYGLQGRILSSRCLSRNLPLHSDQVVNLYWHSTFWGHTQPRKTQYNCLMPGASYNWYPVCTTRLLTSYTCIPSMKGVLVQNFRTITISMINKHLWHNSYCRISKSSSLPNSLSPCF